MGQYKEDSKELLRLLDGHGSFSLADWRGCLSSGDSRGHLLVSGAQDGGHAHPGHRSGVSNIAQGSAVLAMIYLQRKNAEAQEVNVPAWISCYLGVTEPAIFGVNLKYFFPFICGMTGSACAAVVCVSTSTTANAIGVGGVPGILSIQPQYMPSFALSMLVAIVVPFVLTAIIGKKKGVGKVASAAEGGAAAVMPVVAEAQPAAKESEYEFKAFLDGEVISLPEVNDGVFSAGIVGEGLAIRPASELLVAPVSAKVTVLMENSRHAVGLTLSNGVELLLHVGIDTVDMQGEGFEYLVKQGDEVAAGTPLLKFSREKIKAAGHPEVTVCIITNKNGVESFNFRTGMAGKAGETVIASY